MEEYFGLPWTDHVVNMAISIDSHTSAEKIGTVQYERYHMFADGFQSARRGVRGSMGCLKHW